LAANRDDWLKALTGAAAVSLGPIASILVEQAAADGAPFDDVRRRLGTQMDVAAREQFLKATDSLAAGARSVPARAPPPAPPVGPVSDMIDGRDPAFVKALARDLANRLGPQGETLVMDAARRCRTKAQLCVRLASQVADPDLKALLSKLALDDPRLSARPKT
jgi:ABC-type amino acid transport substrate-binding protein